MRGLSLLALVLCAPVGRADERADAKAHYQRGTKLYDLQRYLEAAKEYETAFELRDDPALLFNIGQAYRFGGENQKAVGAFRSYLRRLPHAQNRDEVEARIGDLQRLIDEQKKSQEAPPGGTIATEPSPEAEHKPPPETKPPVSRAVEQPKNAGRTKRIAGLAVGGVGVVGLVLGITFVALANSARNDLSHPAADTRFDPALEDRMKLDQSLGAAFFAVGGAALVTGTVLYLLGRREGKRSVSFSQMLSPRRVAGELRIEF
jgi:tetratricopeptide (TPR) repeat protein